MELIRNTMPTDLKMIKKFRDGLVLNLKNKNIDENLKACYNVFFDLFIQTDNNIV